MEAGSEWPALDALRVLRVLKARVAFFVASAFFRRSPIISTQTLTFIGITVFFTNIVHLCACALGGSAYLSARSGLPSWLTQQTPMEILSEADVVTPATYVWALSFCVYSFTSVGGLMAQNPSEVPAIVFVLMSCMVAFALCLAIFSLIVSNTYRSAHLEAERSRSVVRYCRYRGLSPGTADVLKAFSDSVLPERCLPQQIAEFEQALLNAVTPLVRKDVYMQLYAPLINSAGCLAWLRHSKSMMADVVKYCSIVVIIPGQTLFERGDEIKHICFLQMGGVDAEELAQEMVDEIKSRESLPSIVADSEEDVMSSEGLSENESHADAPPGPPGAPTGGPNGTPRMTAVRRPSGTSRTLATLRFPTLNKVSKDVPSVQEDAKEEGEDSG